MGSIHAAEGAKPTFDLILLGPPTLRNGVGQIPVGLGSGKPLALLCFLVVRGEVPRDEALALLWGDVAEARARNAFRQALHRLRLALGDDLVIGDRQILKIAVGDRLRADVIEFEKALDEGRHEDALGCYKGDFLAGFDVGCAAFEQWAEIERFRLRSRCQLAAERSAQRALVEGRPIDAEVAIRKLLAVAPLDPRAIEVAASSFVAMGRRAEATEVLQQFRRRSVEDLGAPMSPALHVMLDRMASASRNRPVGDATQEIGLVGRSAELGRLLALWQTLDEHSGGTVVIEGPDGIGKTRLVREFADSVRALGVLHMLHGVEGPKGYSVPYAAIANALRPLVRAAGVAGASPHLLAEAARLLPELRDTLQLPSAEPIEDESARLRMCEGVAALVEAAAYERPICLVLEDVHRSPAPTLDLIHYLAPRLRRSPILLVLTLAAEDASHEFVARLRTLAGGASSDRSAGMDESHHLVLAPLSAADTADLVRQVAGSGTPVATIHSVARRAAGNPLRAMELARLVADGVEPSSLPVRTDDIVRDRIRACSANERRLFLAASLISRPAPLRLLAEASHVPAVAAGEAAQALQRRGLLMEEGNAYAPSSDVAVEASVGLAGKATAAFVAAWVADAVAREPDASPAELVRLNAIAGRPSETFRFARLAGERALARGAIDEGIHFLSIARAFARSGPDHAAVESLLTAFGAGRPMLGTPPRPPRDFQSRAASVFVRYFPNWRYLTAAAVATNLLAIAITLIRPGPPAPAFSTRDSLIVARAQESRRGLVHLVTSDPASRVRVSQAVRRESARPSWADSISLPWVNATPSPSGRFVGVERITPAGSSVYLIAADRRDTIPLVVGDEEGLGMGWSPDGEAFLVTRRLNNAANSPAVGLFAFSAIRGRPAVPIDTSPGHSVVEAAWSPDGSRVGWVARVAGGQEDVFVAWTDGSHRRNVSLHPARDYHLAWSADGSLIAFTSRRDGNAELYARDLLSDRLWRLTDDVAQDDRVSFADDGRFVAFESTRGGATDVYVMPGLGGAASRVGDSTTSYELIGWRRSGARYLDRLEIGVPESVHRGDTLTLRVRGLDQFGAPVSPWDARWRVLDQSLLRPNVQDPREASPSEQPFVALTDGLARIEVTIGGWRTDTAYVRIGDGPVSLLHDAFGGPSLGAAWRALGEPSPSVATLGGATALVMNADRQWESGVLSRNSFPLRTGLSVEATLHAPFHVHAAATTASLSLVAPDPPDAIDHDAPRFLRLISITWNADAQRLVYAAEREVFVEAVPDGLRGNARTLAIQVSADGTVAFLVDGVRRWQSTLRAVRGDRSSRAQIWLGGQDTGSRIGFSNVSASLAGPPPARP
ncbi:MAG: AAA family ATPase [Gemmatimonadota bacterium]